jgi:peptidoglycan/xylan/chitin deacetylase (PgdA/CDA1 family)
MNLFAAITAGVCVVSAVLLAVGPGQGAETRPPRVALTFDDLPDHGPLPPGSSRVDVAKSIIDTLKAHHAPPVYGFINANQLGAHPADAEVLRLWREAGFPLGNHTFSHMDLHANTTEDFERDVAANEPTLRSYMGDRDWHWFRFPYLREGNTSEKYRTVRDMLARRGYRVAQVTLSFDDYAYNDPYARCAARNDREGIAWLEQSYRERAAETLDRGREAARAVFGRDIGHVMLLHIGAFETVMLPRLLDVLQEHEFALTTLEEAQADAAYETVPDTGGIWFGTFLDQMAAARRRPPPLSNDVFARLDALCR